MKTSSTGRALIESFEGLFTQAYDDANDRIVKSGEAVKGTLTIGYGHTNAAGAPKITIGQTITKEEADTILSSDLKKVEADVSRLVKVPLNQNQFDALVSFQYNTGALGRASLLTKLNNKDYQGAADGFMSWTKASKISPNPLPGLVRRRQAEKNLFLKPAKTGIPEIVGTGVLVGAGSAVAVSSHAHPWWQYGLGAAGALVAICLAVHLYHKYKGN